MDELPLHALSASEAEDAIDALEDILELEAIGDVDIPPCLTRLFLELEEVLATVAKGSQEALPAPKVLAVSA
jgi:hypothetical protein